MESSTYLFVVALRSVVGAPASVTAPVNVPPAVGINDVPLVRVNVAPSLLILPPVTALPSPLVVTVVTLSLAGNVRVTSSAAVT